MANPYRTRPRRDLTPRSTRGRLLTSSIAFGCACVVAGVVLTRADSRVAFLSAMVGGAIILRRPN